MKDLKPIKSILCCNGPANPSLESYLPTNLNARLHVARSMSRDSLMELVFCLRPELLILDGSIGGDRSWMQVISFLRSNLTEMGIIASLGDLDMRSVQDLTMGGVNGLIRNDRAHLELPFAIRAVQLDEVFLTPQAAKAICDLVQGAFVAGASNDRGLLGSLTNRELEILAALTQGTNYKAIAKLLFVSDSTVKTHVNNIFTKLNVNDRTQAVLYALKHGIDQMAPDVFSRLNLAASKEAQVQTIHPNEKLSKVMNGLLQG